MRHELAACGFAGVVDQPDSATWPIEVLRRAGHADVTPGYWPVRPRMETALQLALDALVPGAFVAAQAHFLRGGARSARSPDVSLAVIDDADAFFVHTRPTPTFDFGAQLALANALLEARGHSTRLTYDLANGEDVVIVAAPTETLERLHRSDLLRNPHVDAITRHC